MRTKVRIVFKKLQFQAEKTLSAGTREYQISCFNASGLKNHTIDNLSCQR
jgi:hypothetical protein